MSADYGLGAWCHNILFFIPVLLSNMLFTFFITARDCDESFRVLFIVASNTDSGMRHH